MSGFAGFFGGFASLFSTSSNSTVINNSVEGNSVINNSVEGNSDMTSNEIANLLRQQLPDRHAQFANAYAVAAVSNPTALLKPIDFALLHAGVIDRESFYKSGGWAIRPKGPQGTGDPTSRWVNNDNIPDWATELSLLTGRDRTKNGVLQLEVAPPAYAGAEVAGWGYGLGQIDFASNRSWLDANDWKDPFVNLAKSASILAGYIDQLNDVRLGVVAYNAGPHHNFGSNPDAFTSGGDYSRDAISRANSFGFEVVRVA